MPLIQVKLIEGVFTETQKREMVRKLTDAMVSIEGENMRPVTWVIVEDVKSGDWGIGGTPPETCVTSTVVTCRNGISPSNANRCHRQAPPSAKRRFLALPLISCSADRSALEA